MSAIVNPATTPAPGQPDLSPPSATPREPSRRKYLILLGLIVAVGTAAYQLWLKPKPALKTPVVVYRTIKVDLGVLQRTLRVSGQTSARNFANITAPLLRGPDSRDSLVLMKLSKAGSLIKRGDTVAMFDPQKSQDHIDDTADTVKQSENDIAKRKAEQTVDWENLQQTLRSLKADYQKSKLDADASETRTVIDQELLKLKAEEDAARLKTQEEILPLKKTVHAAEVHILEITSVRQHRHLDRHLVDHKRLSISAPMDGLIVMQSIWRGGEMGQIQEGDQVYPGQGFMKIVDPSSMQVEASINQAESDELRIGQPAQVSLDAFPGLTFKGRVYSLGALAVGGWRQNFYIRNVPVRVAIEGRDPRLIPDLSAAADVVVAASDKAPLVPLNAVRLENGKRVVYVKRGEIFERREISLGLRNSTHAVVLAGLSGGEEIRLN